MPCRLKQVSMQIKKGCLYQYIFILNKCVFSELTWNFDACLELRRLLGTSTLACFFVLACFSTANTSPGAQCDGDAWITCCWDYVLMRKEK